MKKILILAVAGIAGLTTGVHAQYIRIAPEAGFNISHIRLKESRGRNTHTQSADPKLGLKIGGIVDIGITRTFSIQPGLFFSQKGYRLDENDVNGVVRNKADASRRATFNYIEMPLNVMFKFGRPRHARFIIGGGGYLAYGVSGKVKYGSYAGSSGTTTEDLDFGNNTRNDDYRNVDVGGQLFAGVLMPFGGYLRGQIQGGIANIDPANNDDYRVTNTTASLTFGVMIGSQGGPRGGHRPHRGYRR